MKDTANLVYGIFLYNHTQFRVQTRTTNPICFSSTKKLESQNSDKLVHLDVKYRQPGRKVQVMFHMKNNLGSRQEMVKVQVIVRS